MHEYESSQDEIGRQVRQGQNGQQQIDIDGDAYLHAFSELQYNRAIRNLSHLMTQPNTPFQTVPQLEAHNGRVFANLVSASMNLHLMQTYSARHDFIIGGADGEATIYAINWYDCNTHHVVINHDDLLPAPGVPIMAVTSEVGFENEQGEYITVLPQGHRVIHPHNTDPFSTLDDASETLRKAYERGLQRSQDLEEF